LPFKCNLQRYYEGRLLPTQVGLDKLRIQLTHSLKAPGFNPRSYEVKTRFQAFAFHKCNVYRYAQETVSSEIFQTNWTEGCAQEVLLREAGVEFADLKASLQTLVAGLALFTTLFCSQHSS
jgi:hypothetical protein